MEKLIGEGGTFSESGSEPFTPVMNQRRSSEAPAGNKTTAGRAVGSQIKAEGSQFRRQQQPQQPVTGLLMDDWPFADSSPTDEVRTTAVISNSEMNSSAT